MGNRRRVWIKYGVDLVLWVLATPLAFLLRLEADAVAYVDGMVVLLLIGLPVKALAVYAMHLPWRSWYKVGLRDLSTLLQGVAVVTVFLMGVAVFLSPVVTIPRSVPLLEAMLAVLFLSFARMATRMLSETQRRHVAGKRKDVRQVLIVGAGESGTMIAREMLRHPESGLRPVGFADDDPGKQKKRFLGLPVLGKLDDLPRVLDTYRINEVIIAMPSEAGSVIRRVVEHTRHADIDHRIIPGVYEFLSGQVAISQIRKVNLEDLLRREPVRLDVSDIRGYVEGRVVLVTGAGGSIGSEIVRQVARFGARRVLLLGRGENSIYQILGECRRKWPDLDVRPLICDVRDRERLSHLFEQHHPEVVFHAAAHKHVPLMEGNPDEAVLNNVGGTLNLADLALAHGVERFVNISTDKAVNPTSVMGATKRVAEYVVGRAANYAEPGHSFVSVRFGNVLGSRGSVVPLFKQQIADGGPVTVTDPEMKRYFMTIPEAAQLVLQAGGLGTNGRVYVLDMGEPVKIVDLARDLIHLSGFEPDVDIPIVFNGIRPGEKLFEELLTAEEGTDSSRHEKIFVARKQAVEGGALDEHLTVLFDAAHSRDPLAIMEALAAIVPTHMLPIPNRSTNSGDGASGDGAAEPELLASPTLRA
ncbi:MAG: nucleoside-diphosphate sugar epimerase/dehydratase [Rhodothermales bacterium]